MMMSWHSLLFFFSFVYVHLEEDDDELALIVVFFPFVSVHPKKTTMSQSSLSSFFLLFMCT
jgi:hypothetical protein